MDTFATTLCKSLNVDACIIVGTDPHQLEYPLPHFQARHIVSNFYGSAGTSVLTRTARMALWTDGRYDEEAKQSSKATTEIFIDREDNWKDQIQWIIQACNTDEHNPPSLTIGISNIQISVKNFVLLESVIKKINSSFPITLLPIAYNDILTTITNDKALAKTLAQKTKEYAQSVLHSKKHNHLKNSIWILDEVQKQYPKNALTSPDLSLQKKKFAKLEKWMEAHNVNIYISANTHELSWLTDLRSMYIHYLMLFPAFFYYNRTAQSLHLYIPLDLHTEHTKTHIEILRNRLAISITLFDYDDFISSSHIIERKIAMQSPKHHSIAYDPYNIPVALHNSNYTPITSPITLWKSIASQREIEDVKYTNQIDNGALLEAMASVGERYKQGQCITEQEASDLLLKQRMRHPFFLQESFNTISAKGENAALPHYKTPDYKVKVQSPIISEDDIYLLDSGAHYLYGTTDLTRVYHFGSYGNNKAVSSAFQDDYTFVLKAHIALARFRKTLGDVKKDAPIGKDLDAISRTVLKNSGRDYQHGTGHGIGYCTDVHDGVQRIGLRANQKIYQNMIMSNEPGYYKSGQWGIRIENMMVSRINASNEFHFETLSYFPLQTTLINKQLLTETELVWIEQYHAQCQALLFPDASAQAKEFFMFLTQ